MRLSPNDMTVVKNSLEQTIRTFYGQRNERILVGRQLHERTLVFRFGLLLSQQVPLLIQHFQRDFHIDCEYNKNQAGVKHTPSRPRGCYPDIVIHKRGNNRSNLLVIEFKGHWNARGRIGDENKLKDFTSQRGGYKYGLGAFIDLHPNSAEVTYYTNRAPSPIIVIP